MTIHELIEQLQNHSGRQKPRPSLSIEMHVCLGQYLKSVRDNLIAIQCKNRYTKTSGPTAALARASTAIDHLRFVMDEQASLDWPDEFVPQWYYPGPNPRAEVPQAADGEMTASGVAR